MAVARLSLKRRSRGRGPCVVAAAAYRHGVALRDERTGRRFDYDRRDDILWSEVVVPDGVPPFARTLAGCGTRRKPPR